MKLKAKEKNNMSENNQQSELNLPSIEEVDSKLDEYSNQADTQAIAEHNIRQTEIAKEAVEQGLTSELNQQNPDAA